MSLQKVLPPNPPRDDYATFEHIVARSRGGDSAAGNIVLAHYRCNQLRGDGVGPNAGSFGQ